MSDKKYVCIKGCQTEVGGAGIVCDKCKGINGAREASLMGKHCVTQTEKACKTCGNLFTPKSNRQEYCKKECKVPTKTIKGKLVVRKNKDNGDLPKFQRLNGYYLAVHSGRTLLMNPELELVGEVRVK